MSSLSPVSVLFSSDGYELAVINSSAIPANTRAIIAAGSDGTNAHYMLMDSSGRPVVVGAGVAGTPTGGILTIQGATSMTAVLVNNATAANLLANVGGLAAAGSASSGNPVWIAGNVTTAAPGYSNATVNALSLTTTGQLRIDSVYPLATTAANSPDVAQVGGAVTTAAPTYTTATTNALSLDTAGNLRVTGAGGTFPVSGTVTANAGTGTFNVAGTGTAGTPNAGVVTIQGISGGTAIPISGTVTANFTKSTTGTITSVAGSVTSVQLLASNSNRLGAFFFNDSVNAMAYIALSSSAASITAFTTKIFPGDYWEMPIDYTGVINCIWNNATANMRITEMS